MDHIVTNTKNVWFLLQSMGSTQYHQQHHPSAGSNISGRQTSQVLQPAAGGSGGRRKPVKILLVPTFPLQFAPQSTFFTAFISFMSIPPKKFLRHVKRWKLSEIFKYLIYNLYPKLDHIPFTSLPLALGRLTKKPNDF